MNILKKLETDPDRNYRQNYNICGLGIYCDHQECYKKRAHAGITDEE